MKTKAITTIMITLFLASIMMVSVYAKAPVTKVPFDVIGDVALEAEGSIRLTSTGGSVAAVLMLLDSVPLEDIEDWDLRFQAIPRGGEPGNPWGGTDVPYFIIMVTSPEHTAIIHSTGTSVLMVYVDRTFDVIGNGEDYIPGEPGPPRTGRYRYMGEVNDFKVYQGWVLAFVDGEAATPANVYGVPAGALRGDWPGLTLPELIDYMLAAQPDSVVTAIGVQIEFEGQYGRGYDAWLDLHGGYDPNVEDTVVKGSVVIDEEPTFPCASSDVIVLLKTGVLNQGQANSLIVKILHGSRRAYENEINALYKAGILTDTQRDGLLNAPFY